MIKNLVLGIFILGTALLSGQNCSQYYPMEEGVTMEYTSFNGKGKKEGTIAYKVIEVEDNGNSSTARLEMNYKDAKGDEIFNSGYSYTCSGNIVTIDYESLLSNQMLEQFGEMDMEVTGTDIELPNDLGVGQELEDANINITISMSGMTMKSSVEMVNRKVEKKESVTTPAGTFDCFVLYSENRTKMMVSSTTMSSRLWLAEGVGMVKQESYNKKGKLMSSSVLSAKSD